MKNIRKLFSLLLVVLCCLSLVGCSGGNDATEAGDGAEEVTYKAAFITTSPLGNDFVDLTWKGFQDLEAEGWEVKCIEALDPAEYADDIRAMSEEGYQVIMTWTDDLSEVVLELADELGELYPDTHYFLLDVYMDQTHPNVTTVSVDCWESSFVAGYIAAKTTETKEVGWIGHWDVTKIRRFRNGYMAGVAYADPTVVVHDAFTLDPFDPQKGLETAQALLAQYPNTDIVYQSAYLAGPGVISVCADAGIKCIGVDDWQGDIDPCVFWSAIKPMDNAVFKIAQQYKNGESFPLAMDFNIKAGGACYDERDYVKLSDELKAEVDAVMAGIKDGSINIYEGYEDWRLDY